MALDFDSRLSNLTARLCNRIVGPSCNALYLPPIGEPGEAVRVRAAVHPTVPSTTRDFDGRDEISHVRSQADVPVADFAGRVPVKYGRLRLDSSPDPENDLTIVEVPVLQAGCWELTVARGDREQIGLPRTGA